MTMWTKDQLQLCMNPLLKGRPRWLIKRQQHALDQFLKNGFPVKKQPAWQYTSTHFIQDNRFTLSNTSTVFKAYKEIIDQSKSDFYTIIFINGHYIEQLSCIAELQSKNVSLVSLNEVSLDSNNYIKNAFFNIDTLKILDAPFINLAQALLTDCFFLNIPKGIQLDKPIRILHLTDKNFSLQMRHNFCFFQLENNAKAIIFEEVKHLSSEFCFSNCVVQITLKEKANLSYYYLQPLSNQLADIHQLILLQAKNSCYQHYDLAQGAEFARNERRIYLQGKKAQATLKGIFSVTEDRSIDSYIHIDHQQSETISHQFYKGLASDRSHAIFNSHVLIPKAIKKTQASQLSKNLLLSSHAEINLKPTLEIYTDDVQCSHGATIGAIDEKALFYLCSRGINRKQAEQLLKEGFLTEIIETIPHANCRKHMNNVL